MPPKRQRPQSSYEFERIAFDASALGTALLDADGHCIQVNPALCVMLGCAASDLAEKNFLDLTCPEDVKEEYKLFAELRSSNGASYQREKRYRHRDGRTLWVQQTLSAARDKTGKISFFVLQIQDISERKMREQLHEQRFLLIHRFAESVPGMAAYWTDELKCAFANGAYQEWFNKAPSEMPGISMRELLGDKLFQLNEPYIRGALRGETQQFERTLTKANGDIGYTWAQYIPDFDGPRVKGFYVLVSDISELKRAEAEIIKVNQTLKVRTAEAEAANHAKDLFLSMVSHELRSPLHTILGHTDLLARQADDETSHRLRIIAQNGKQLLRLIDDILSFSVANSGAPLLEHSPTTLSSLIEQLESNGSLCAQRRHNRFSIEAGHDLPPAVLVDGKRLGQALMNLIENACKFTEDGFVTVKISKSTEGFIHFSVHDTGVGISETDQAAIFNPFIRVHEQHHQPGIGLGLAISQQLIRAMGGEITVSSAPGKGSCFQFSLVLPEVDHAELAQSEPGESWRNIVGHRGPQRTLLIADDIDANRDLLQEACETWGFRVLTAKNSREARAQCNTAPPRVDAALIDQIMIGGDGWDFLSEVRQSVELRNMPTIMISAQAPKRPAKLPKNIQFDAVLQKPLSLSELSTVLQNLLGVKWIIRDEENAAGAHLQFPLPPRKKLKELDEMLALGRLSAVIRWVDELQETSDSKYAGFAEHVRRLGREINLDELREFSTHALAQSSRKQGPRTNHGH